MTMSPGVRKFALALHLTLSAGWIGAVAAYLALDVASATSQDTQTLLPLILAWSQSSRMSSSLRPSPGCSPGSPCHLGRTGLVPALLGPDLIHTDRHCDSHLAAGATSDHLLRRHGS
jgi:hypothetical protein